MEKYKRFYREISGDEEIQKFLDELTTDGWSIIFYDEKIKNVHTIVITIVCKKSEKLVL